MDSKGPGRDSSSSADFKREDGMQAGNDQMGSPRQCEETAIEDSDDDFSSTGGECIREETTGNTDMNKSTRTRREKRLAMNRESARKRRKENKVLMQSLEIRVAELSKSNQQYRHANESLSSIVQSLENELAQARSVIGRWTSVTSGNQLQLQQRFDPQAGLALIARSQPRRNEFGIFPSGIPAGAEVQLGDNLGRLRQAQLEQLTSQGGAAGLSLARAGTGSQFADASILRRHTLDALSRVTQTTDGSLGSLIRAPSFPSNAMSDFNNSYLRIPGSPLMVRPDVLQNVCVPQHGPNLGDGRVGMDFAESSQSTRVHDAMSHAAALYQGGARTGVGLTHHQQQFLEGLIRQKKQELARNQQGKSEK